MTADVCQVKQLRCGAGLTSEQDGREREARCERCHVACATARKPVGASWKSGPTGKRQ